MTTLRIVNNRRKKKLAYEAWVVRAARSKPVTVTCTIDDINPANLAAAYLGGAND